MIGVIMAVCVIGGIQSALTLINVSAQAQEVVTGCLLIDQRRVTQLGATLGPSGGPELGAYRPRAGHDRLSPQVARQVPEAQAG